MFRRNTLHVGPRLLRVSRVEFLPFLCADRQVVIPTTSCLHLQSELLCVVRGIGIGVNFPKQRPRIGKAETLEMEIAIRALAQPRPKRFPLHRGQKNRLRCEEPDLFESIARDAIGRENQQLYVAWGRVYIIFLTIWG